MNDKLFSLKDEIIVINGAVIAVDCVRIAW